MIEIDGCLCTKCHEWHSHVYPDKDGKNICINCINKKRGFNFGRRK